MRINQLRQRSNLQKSFVKRIGVWCFRGAGSRWLHILLLLLVIGAYLLYVRQSHDYGYYEQFMSASLAAVGQMDPDAVNAQQPRSNGPLRFVMFLGLEGTGHHFWQDLIKASAVRSRLVETELYPNFSKRLMRLLYRHKRQRWGGLWSAPCKWADTDPASNTTQAQQDLAALLTEMSEHVKSQIKPNGDAGGPGHTDDDDIVFPVNFLSGGNEFGVMSYPNFLNPCRALMYPNLDVWYEACNMAGVTCEHVYIYRNPYAVIKSTTLNRNFNTDVLGAIHLYTTQLHTLHSQLMMRPKSLVGCWDYDDRSSWRADVQPLLQMKDDQAFDDLVNMVYKKKKEEEETGTGDTRTPINGPEQDRSGVSLNDQPYMRSMVKVHDAVVTLCRSIRSQATN